MDLNCDMGEGMSNDAELMPFLNSANIACGYHAGSPDIMRATIKLAMAHGVAIGAHVSFPDREHFGRREMQLGPAALYDMIVKQLDLLALAARENNAVLHHVKPHGALYNMSARDEQIATVIAAAVKDFNPSLRLYGLSGSVSVQAARAAGLAAWNEVFADRSYRDDGSLTPRTESNALIGHEKEIDQQVRGFMKGRVRTTGGNLIPVKADTICIHGDSPQALRFAPLIAAITRGNKGREAT